MKSYKYIARDTSGKRREGLKEAASSNDVLGWLRDQGFTPVSVNEISAGPQKTKQKGRRKRIKSADLAALCWQLTTMVEGGISITTALETICEDLENVSLQQILLEVVEKVNHGETLSDSFSAYPRVFNRLSCAMILAGEAGGNLPEVLRQLAEYFDNRDKLAKKVKGAMAYPVFVIGFIILIVIFIMTFIVPRFEMIFEQFSGELPAFTRGFMGFYDLLKYQGIYIIALISLVIVGAVLTYRKSEKGHYAFSKIALMIPFMGKVLSHAFIVMFCRTMATLIGAGVSVLEVLDILSTMTNNDIIKDAVVRTKEAVVGGSNISVSLAESGFFPNMVIKMIQVGEESGSLSRVLDRTSNFYERKVDATITAVMSLLEPIMIVTVGGVVLVVVLALYLPIFSMSA
ncbi:MAG: type II secretion system F family protein [Planctomycetota bacterium]|jgi:type IV pilus assembly protein PilC